MSLKKYKKIINSYSIVTIVLIIASLYVSNYSMPKESREILSGQDFLSEEIINNIEITPGLSVFFLFLAAIVISAIFNFIRCFLKIIRKKPLIKNNPKTENKIKIVQACRITFWVIAIYLITYSSMSFFLPDTISDNTYLNTLILANTAVNFLIIIALFFLIPFKTIKCYFDKKEIFSSLKIYLASLPLIFIVMQTVLNIGELFNIEPETQVASDMFFIIKNLIFLAIFSLEACIIAPVSEELLFRGFIYKFLRKHLGIITSIITTSFFFALLHDNFYGFFMIFILSITLCYIYEKTQNLMNAIVIHITHNSLACLCILTLRQYLSPS